LRTEKEHLNQNKTHTYALIFGIRHNVLTYKGLQKAMFHVTKHGLSALKRVHFATQNMAYGTTMRPTSIFDTPQAKQSLFPIYLL